MDRAEIWAALRAKYFDQWTKTGPDDWVQVRLKMDMIDELREELRKVANAGEIDNARDPSAE